MSLLRRVRRGVRQARVRLWVTPDTRHAFRIGYLAALDDLERTGVAPSSRDAKNHSAAVAFDRVIREAADPRPKERSDD